MRGSSPGNRGSRGRGGSRAKQTTLLGRRHGLMLLMVGYPGSTMSAYTDVFERLTGVKVNSAEVRLLLDEVSRGSALPSRTDTDKERYVRAIRQANVFVGWAEVNRLLVGSGFSSIDKRFYDEVGRDIVGGKVLSEGEVSMELARRNPTVMGGSFGSPGFFGKEA